MGSYSRKGPAYRFLNLGELALLDWTSCLNGDSTSAAARCCWACWLPLPWLFFAAPLCSVVGPCSMNYQFMALGEKQFLSDSLPRGLLPGCRCAARRRFLRFWQGE